MTTQEQIIQLFATLNDAQKVELQKTLSTDNISTSCITAFAKKIQKEYGESISFDVEESFAFDEAVIEVTVKTPYGSFTATGRNKKIAKAKAVTIADAKFVPKS